MRRILTHLIAACVVAFRDQIIRSTDDVQSTVTYNYKLITGCGMAGRKEIERIQRGLIEIPNTCQC